MLGLREREGFSSPIGFHEPETEEYTVTFYPDADPEVTSFDGVTAEDQQTVGVAWETLIAAVGNTSQDSLTSILLNRIGSGTGNQKWDYLTRGIFLFDTSVIPVSAVITSAVFSVFGSAKIDTLGIKPDINVYSSSPLFDNKISNVDFSSLGSTPFCNTPLPYDNFDVAGYNNFMLNAAGLAAIAKEGITKLGTRNANYDVAAIAPSWISNRIAGLSCWSSEKGDGYKPKLVVTYEV